MRGETTTTVWGRSASCRRRRQSRIIGRVLPPPVGQVTRPTAAVSRASRIRCWWGRRVKVMRFAVDEISIGHEKGGTRPPVTVLQVDQASWVGGTRVSGSSSSMIWGTNPCKSSSLKLLSRKRSSNAFSKRAL